MLRTGPLSSAAPARLAAAVLALALLACGGRQGEERPAAVAPLPAQSNLLLITVDTLRADHLSAWGYPRATSPVVDRLAVEGVRFDRAVVQWPKTTPSFASMFTSTYAKDNGMVRRVGVPLSCRFVTLAERLERQGYTTAAVVANGALASEFDFDQGFGTYVETWKLPHGADGADPNRAEAVTRLATGLLDRLARPGKPWFLWVHYLDPHAPYAPPGEWSRRFQGDAHFDPARRIEVVPKPKQQMTAIGRDNVLDGRTDLAFYAARYDAEIAYTDHEIGRLLDEMRRRGLLARTLTAFTADHGESLGEHEYYFDHGRFSFETCLHVPLVLHYPGVLAPRVDREPVELVDLAPTLLEAAGIALPGGAWMQGRSLTPRLRGVQAPPPPANPGAWTRPSGLAFAEAGWETNDHWQKVVEDGRFKLIYAQTRPEQRWIGGEGVRFTLYDLANDPGETENVAHRFPRDLERLKRQLWAWNRAPRFPAETDPQGGTCEGRGGMDEETRQLLESLGYL